MIIAILSVLSAGTGVVTYSLGLVALPQTLEVLEQQKQDIKGLYEDNQISYNEYGAWTNFFDTYEYILPSAMKGGLTASVLDLTIGALLLVGLTSRKHGLMLPWLVSSMFQLVLMCVFFLGASVLQFSVLKSCSGGFLTLAIAFPLAYLTFYIWKVVQSEWMNVREGAGTGTGHVEHYGKEGFTFHKFENSECKAVIDPPPKYPGLEGV